VRSLSTLANRQNIPYELFSTDDWSLDSGGTSPEKINASMTKWLTGSVCGYGLTTRLTVAIFMASSRRPQETRPHDP
jgi:hypothetical protein